MLNLQLTVTVYQADREDPWHYIWTGWVGEDSLPLLQKLNVSRQSHKKNGLRRGLIWSKLH